MYFPSADRKGSASRRFTEIESLESRVLLSTTLPASALGLLYRPAGKSADSQPVTTNSNNLVITSSATIWQPMTSADLTTALNNSQLGDTIILHAGTTYVGQFTLPNKTTGTGWITIQSSNLASLPGAGVRVSPSDAVNMPKIQAPGSNVSALQTPPGTPSHHFKIIGVEFIGPANNGDLVQLVELGTDQASQSTLASVPHDLVIDRCYLHPNTPTASVRRAIALNSASTDITNCYIEEIHQDGSDSQAIAGWNGSGPFNILNNFLEAASENVMFGGSTARIPNVVSSDIVIRGNYFYKPLSWRGVHPVKNNFEIKTARNVTIDGNIFENCWNSGQDGTAIILKTNLDASWATSDNISFTNNIVRHAASAIGLQGYDYQQNGGHLWGVTIRNNLFEDIDGAAYGGHGWLFYLNNGVKNVTIDHNDGFQSSTFLDFDGDPENGIVVTNNIGPHNSYGVLGSGYSVGDSTLTHFMPDGTFTKNILMGGNSTLYKNHPGNYFPATWSAVGFTDMANANYRLLTTSAYHNVASDGTDLGINQNNLVAATLGAISGVWSAPSVSSISRNSASPINATTVSWSVNFSNSVIGVDASDFSLATSGITGAIITSVTGSGAAYTVTASTGSGQGTLGLNLVDDDTIQDSAAEPLGGTGTGNGNFTGEVYAIDMIAPTVASMVRANPSPTGATSVNWTVTFSEAVSGVDASDFALAVSGLTGAAITNVTGSGTTWTVTASTGNGAGTLGLNLVDDDSVSDAAGNKLGGTGAGNGNLTGEVYSVDRSVPTVSSINCNGATTTTASSVSWTVTLTKSVTGLDATDFLLSYSGIAGAAITNITGSGTSYVVTASTGTGSGSLRLKLVDNDSIVDSIGTPLGGTGTGNGNFTSQTFIVDRTPPEVYSITRNNLATTNVSSVKWTVTFLESVTSVEASDFGLVVSGITGASITGVSGSGKIWTITANTGSGSGTVGLNLVDNDSIQDLVGNVLGGAGSLNGNFAGEIYTINRP